MTFVFAEVYFTIFLGFIHVSVSNGQICSSSKFGTQCRYDCHCAPGAVCNPNTGCPNPQFSQQKCAAGWDGNTCQRRNVALRRPANQDSTLCAAGSCYNAANAVDGRTGHNFYTTPCTHTLGNQQTERSVWNVTLDKTYNIYRFTIYNRNDCCQKRLNGFELSVGQTFMPDKNYRLCYRDETSRFQGTGDVITRTCDQQIRGDLVRITQPDGAKPLTLCEVLIYVCSPGWYGEMCDKQCISDTDCLRCSATQLRCAECRSGKWGDGCTQKCGNCWNSNQCIKESGICPKTVSDSFRCTEGYEGDKCIQVCPAGKYGSDCIDTCGFCREGSFSCTSDTGLCQRTQSGRCLLGYRGDRCKDVCLPGTYGKDCVDTCGNCAEGKKKCAKDTGICHRLANVRCSVGFTGELCITDCSPGRYGSDCVKLCGMCSGGAEQCFKDSGICPLLSGSARCSPGRKGELCDELCDDGEYGADCSQRCVTCTCEMVSGRCQGPCSPGYQGEFCDKECADGFYGNECKQTCGACKGGNSSCAHTDGRCPNCELGWHGQLCEQECSKGTWGENCENNCSINCKLGPTECDMRTGTCMGGCLDGFIGITCAPDDAAQSGGHATAAIVGGVVAAVVALILVVIIVIFIMKRRRSTKNTNKSAGTTTTSRATPAGGYSENDSLSENNEMGTHRKEAKRQDDGPGYYNVVSFKANSAAIAVDELEAYVSRKKTSGELKIEFEDLPTGLNANAEIAKKAENKGKSRFQDIVAYDHSRVVLQSAGDSPHSDYINACYIHGFKEENKYVASQGPTVFILHDFWRMVWQLNTGKIIMLTNLMEDMKKKCDQYWPDSGTVEYGAILVALMHEDTYADFVIRTLELTNKQEPKKTKLIKQFHFTTWPDHGVPSYATALLVFRDKVQMTKTPLKGPLVIHCSAGIGRTGTFIGLDYLLDQALEDDIVDVPGCVRLLRQQRVNMIQTNEQYVFLHEAVVEALKLSECSVPSTQFPGVYRDLTVTNPTTGQNKLQDQFQMLKEMSPTLAKCDLKAALSSENKCKNRSKEILAGCQGGIIRILNLHTLEKYNPSKNVRCTPFPRQDLHWGLAAGLLRHMSADALHVRKVIVYATYIAYKKKRAFIITQMPLPGTVVDFWRLIYEQHVSSLIMLNTEDKPGKNIGVYWPTTSEREQYGPFDVVTLETEDGEFYAKRTLQLKYKKGMEKDRPCIKHFQCKFWPGNAPVPESSSPLISLMEDVERWQQQTENGPVIVHCMDGVSKSGLYCVINSIIERLKVDQEVNIIQTVKQMRINRPEIVKNMKQFSFIHEAVLSYMNSFETYANFR